MKSTALARSIVVLQRPAYQVNRTCTQQRLASTSSSTYQTPENKSKDIAESTNKGEASSKPKKYQKTMAEADEEMRRAMETLAGDGGESGVEFEDGKPVAMKRGVRENMFRYI